MRKLTCAVLFLSQAFAQQVVAPTPEQVGPLRGENTGDYNITDSVELGYRFAETAGDRGMYRSDVNYGNGIRLLGSSFTMNSKDGHGKFFDAITLNTIGLGNDPYESARLRIEKNRLYDYNLNWRLNDYYNPALPIAFGYHFEDTRRMMQDQDLTLLPQSKIQIHLGYSNNTQTGPALTSLQDFDTRSGIFPLFEDVKRSYNEYRVGADLNFWGARLTVMHRWEYFKDDTPVSLYSGTNPFDSSVLSSFYRAEPTHGRAPSWLGNLVANKKWWSVNARMVYTGGVRGFIQDEISTGIDRSGNGINRENIISGDANRPFSNGDLTFSFFPGDRFTLVNQTAFYNQRIDGNSQYLEYDYLAQTANAVNFSYLGIRTISNGTDLHYKASKWLAVYAGYHYATRRIQTIAGYALADGGPSSLTFAQMENHQNVGAFGFRMTPLKGLTINGDGEIGRNNNPLAALSDRDYHAITARARYKVSKLQFTALYRQKYNNNSVTLTSYSSRSRDYSANAVWLPNDRFSLDLGYSKIHLDSVAGIAFFATVPRISLVQGMDSIYVSNIHAATLTARFAITKRVDLFAGYSITKDTGDGRQHAVPTGTTDPLSLLFLPVQTFPLSYQSPLMRVSVKISPKVRWNAGWQYYNYHEDFGLFGIYQNYHANTGYTSVMWAF